LLRYLSINVVIDELVKATLVRCGLITKKDW
jgi:hypothetical protein